jgi:hypothetical protein
MQPGRAIKQVLATGIDGLSLTRVGDAPLASLDDKGAW